MYLPAAAIFIYLLYTILSPFASDLLLSVSLLALGMFFINLMICWLINEIATVSADRQSSISKITINPYILMITYILLPIHTLEYHIGQFNTLACFFLVLGIFCILKRKENLGLLWISMGAVIKVVIVLFLIFFLLSKKPMRTFFKNLFWAFLPHGISLILILAIPKLLFDFFNQIQVSINVLPPRFNMPANVVDFLRYNELASTTMIAFMSFVILAINFVYFYAYKKGMCIVDQVFFISMILINISPILYVTHIKIFLPIILLWFAVRKTDESQDNKAIKLEKAIKIIIMVPALSIAAWMYYPYLFIIFLGVMIGNIALSSYNHKDWLERTTK